MIRVRISKWVRPENLVERGYKYIADTKTFFVWFVF